MEWKVAPTYQDWKIVSIDEAERKAHVATECWKCNGSGIYAPFGTCFACQGSGYAHKTVKIYTPDEYNRYVAEQEKAREKKIANAKEAIAEKERNSEKNKRELLDRWGFEEEPFVYLILGNTYEIKDIIKERGGRYNPELGWHFTRETELPEGYSAVKVPFDDLYDWSPIIKKINLKENAREIADAAKYADNPSTSEFEGEIKQRLRELKVTLTGRRDVQSAYGMSTLYTFSPRIVVCGLSHSIRSSMVSTRIHLSLSLYRFCSTSITSRAPTDLARSSSRLNRSWSRVQLAASSWMVCFRSTMRKGFP